jgi:hypothetical protein
VTSHKTAFFIVHRENLKSYVILISLLLAGFFVAKSLSYETWRGAMFLIVTTLSHVIEHPWNLHILREILASTPDSAEISDLRYGLWQAVNFLLASYFLAAFSTLKKETEGSSEGLFNFYWIVRCHTPKTAVFSCNCTSGGCSHPWQRNVLTKTRVNLSYSFVRMGLPAWIWWSQLTCLLQIALNKACKVTIAEFWN